MFKKMLTVALAALCLISTAPAAFAAPTPTEELSGVVDKVIELLADKEMDKAERRTEVVAQIRSKFDFIAMSRFILGPNWKNATEEERKRFVDIFTQILEATYIGRIEAYTDEKVRYVGEDLRKDKARVETMVVSASAEIPVDYSLYEAKEGWRVYDVSVEGVSLVRNYRDTYKTIIRKDGMAGLLEQMAEKLKEMKAGQ